jgi:mono/diheme cytochrome c family protein
MASRVFGIALAAATAATLAACGGGHSSRSATHSTSRSAGGVFSNPSGETIFAEHCSVCHSLNGHDNPRLQGGDLLGFHGSRAQTVQFVREMPIVHRPLTATELQAVVDYVMTAERRAAGH